jgi:Domain of unknown function (DUF4157)
MGDARTTRPRNGESLSDRSRSVDKAVPAGRQVQRAMPRPVLVGAASDSRERKSADIPELLKSLRHTGAFRPESLGLRTESAATHPVNVRFSPPRLPLPSPPSFKSGNFLQAKLLVGEVNDPLEREADRTADQVIGMSPSGLDITHAPFQLSRKCSSCEEQDGQLQRMPHFTPTKNGPAPAAVSEALQSPGQPLDARTRAFFEPRFASDFSHVRIHSDEQATKSARSVGARAYTVGQQVVFGQGEYAPDTAQGRRLLAHELAHTLQQRHGVQRLRRNPGPPTVPVKALEPLEAVAQRIARLAVGPSSAAVNLEGAPGKVVSVIRNVRTGQLYVGLNTGTPSNLTAHVESAIEAQRRRIALAQVRVVHTAADAVGGHAEVNALNSAIKDEQAALGHAMTSEEVSATFEMHNVWLSGRRALTTAARCEHCAFIARDVKVTQSLLRAEGGASGEIKIPQRGQAVLSGGKTVEAETIHGEIPHPSAKPPTSMPEKIPETVPEVKVPRVPSAGASAARLVVTEIALNVLLFAVVYYLNKWHAEKQARKFNNDLKGLLPELNARLKTKATEIEKIQSAFPLVYGNVTIVYTHDRYQQEDYNEGSMSIRDVEISHQNYQTPEKLISPYDPFHDKDPSYSLTFSVPLFEEAEAEKGASRLVGAYRQVRDNLTYPAYKVRLSAVITLYKLAKQDSTLEMLVIRDLLGMLKDEDDLVRLAAAVFLGRLKANIAVQYMREIIPMSGNDKQKELIERALRELEQG